MNSRPLELSSRLRPLPPGLVYAFLVNLMLIGLFFQFFGSRFVLSPGLGASFVLPTAPAEALSALPATDYINVSMGPSGLLIYADTKRTLAQYEAWLSERRAVAAERGIANPGLLIIADGNLPADQLTAVGAAAAGAGFQVQFAVKAAEPPPGLF